MREMGVENCGLEELGQWKRCQLIAPSIKSSRTTLTFIPHRLAMTPRGTGLPVVLPVKTAVETRITGIQEN